MADDGKPLAGQVRAAAAQDLGALSRTAAASWELARSDDEYTTSSLLADIAAMEAILDRLLKVIGRG